MRGPGLGALDGGLPRWPHSSLICSAEQDLAWLGLHYTHSWHYVVCFGISVLQLMINVIICVTHVSTTKWHEARDHFGEGSLLNPQLRGLSVKPSRHSIRIDWINEWPTEHLHCYSSVCQGGCICLSSKEMGSRQWKKTVWGQFPKS